MSKQWQKYIDKLDKKRAEKVLALLERIYSLDRTGLDIKKLTNQEQIRRCRVGTLRILFSFDRVHIKILKIRTRGDVYK